VSGAAPVVDVQQASKTQVLTRTWSTRCRRRGTFFRSNGGAGIRQQIPDVGGSRSMEQPTCGRTDGLELHDAARGRHGGEQPRKRQLLHELR